MKRIHLFEFEDFAWFPNWLRVCLTRYLNAMHKMMNTSELLADLLVKALGHAEEPHILDMCSGSGGPMIDTLKVLKDKHQMPDVRLTLSDLYPNQDAAEKINTDGNPHTAYLTSPVNAAKVDEDRKGVRTMVCSMHHMKPEIAKSILKNAKEDRQPICIYEISNNSAPFLIWPIAIPFAFIMVLFITPFIRPMTWQQLVFTYLIPVLPLFIAWDGAVSNARTYTLEDIDELLNGLDSADYKWEKGVLKGKGGNKLYLLGLPV